MKKIVLVVALACLTPLIFQSPTAPRARAQTGPGYVDALGTQAALNTQATLAAYQQQQSAAQAQQAAAAAQAQAAALQAQAYAQAQQATAIAQQQQAQIIAAQATADAAALQATVIVEQTRTAVELEVTRQAARVSAETTQQALNAQSTREAISVYATRSSVDAQRRDNEAIATAVVMSIEATQAAIARQARTEIDFASATQRVLSVATVVVDFIMVLGGVLLALLLGKFFRAQWRSQRLNPRPAPSSSNAAQSIIDADTGEISPRFAIIEYDGQSENLADALRVFEDD